MVGGPVLTTVAFSDLRPTTNHGHVLQNPMTKAIVTTKTNPEEASLRGSVASA